MKTINYIRACNFLSILLVCINGFSQNKQLELKDLNIPNSPAFTILDLAPSTIDRPGTAKAFAMSLVSIASEGSLLPKNFAIEFAPFWFFKNKLNAYTYLGIDKGSKKQTNIFSNVRNFSFSLGSVNRDSSKKHPYSANYISGGIRINPIRIVRKTMISTLITTMDNLANRQVSILFTAVPTCSAFTVGTPEYNSCLAKALTTAFTNDKEYNALEEKLEKLLEVRPAFSLDLAAAGSLSFKDNNWGEHHKYRTGFWGTLAYHLPMSGMKDVNKLLENKNYINLYATSRFMKQDTTVDFKKFVSHNLWDLGGRLEAELGNFSLSFESIHRFNQTDDALSTHRNVGILQYKVNDKLYLSGSFGKNFGKVTNLVALFGLNWGFGKQSITE